MALLGGVALSGCGEGDGSAATEAPQFSEAGESPTAFGERLAKLIETTTAKKDCAQLDQINARSYTRFSCPADKQLRTSMASFKVVGAEEYGTGAVVDYKSGSVKDGAAIVLFVAPDRNWGIGRFGVITKPSANTSDEQSRDGYDKAVEKYLAAVRDRDCDAFVKAVYTSGAKKAEICKTAFLGTKDLAKRLKLNPSVTPEYQGGNESFGFYALETAKPKPKNVTISVVKSTTGKEAPYLILDVAPSPTAAEQVKARRQIQKQREEQRNPGDMSPSSKPSDPAVTTP